MRGVGEISIRGWGGRDMRGRENINRKLGRTGGGASDLNFGVYHCFHGMLQVILMSCKCCYAAHAAHPCHTSTPRIRDAWVLHTRPGLNHGPVSAHPW